MIFQFLTEVKLKEKRIEPEAKKELLTKLNH